MTIRVGPILHTLKPTSAGDRQARREALAQAARLQLGHPAPRVIVEAWEAAERRRFRRGLLNVFLLAAAIIVGALVWLPILWVVN